MLTWWFDLHVMMPCMYVIAVASQDVGWLHNQRIVLFIAMFKMWRWYTTCHMITLSCKLHIKSIEIAQFSGTTMMGWWMKIRSRQAGRQTGDGACVIFWCCVGNRITFGNFGLSSSLLYCQQGIQWVKADTTVRSIVQSERERGCFYSIDPRKGVLMVVS